MAATRVVLALDALADLDRELSMVVLQAESATASVDPVVVEGLRLGLAQVQSVQRRVRKQVVASVAEDDQEWRASVLRTRTLVVLGQLQLLEHAARESDVRFPSSAFATVGELRRYLVGRIARIHSALRHAADDIDTTVGSDATRRMLHSVALGKAEYGFTALALDLDVSTILHAGTRSSSAMFATACQALLLALGNEMVAGSREGWSA